MTANSAVIAFGPPITGRVRCAGGTSKHRLNLARQIVEMATRINRRFLARAIPYVRYSRIQAMPYFGSVAMASDYEALAFLALLT